jgi:hypothetical protein
VKGYNQEICVLRWELCEMRRRPGIVRDLLHYVLEINQFQPSSVSTCAESKLLPGGHGSGDEGDVSLGGDGPDVGTRGVCSAPELGASS